MVSVRLGGGWKPDTPQTSGVQQHGDRWRDTQRDGVFLDLSAVLHLPPHLPTSLSLLQVLPFVLLLEE